MSRIREESTFAVPHFPRMEQGDPQLPPDEDLLKDELFPQDMYSGTTYWADLPLGQRIKWVNATSDAEARREFLLLLSELKKDPLQPIRDYFGTYVITGMGMFVEGTPRLFRWQSDSKDIPSFRSGTSRRSSKGCGRLVGKRIKSVPRIGSPLSATSKSWVLSSAKSASALSATGLDVAGV